MIYVFNIKFYEIMTNNVQSSPRPLPRCLWTVFAQHIVLNRNFYNCTFYSIDAGSCSLKSNFFGKQMNFGCSNCCIDSIVLSMPVKLNFTKKKTIKIRRVGYTWKSFYSLLILFISLIACLNEFNEFLMNNE